MSFVLVVTRIAVRAAQSAARDSENQARGSAGISRGGTPWLVVLRLPLIRLSTFAFHAYPAAGHQAQVTVRDYGVARLDASGDYRIGSARTSDRDRPHFNGLIGFDETANTQVVLTPGFERNAVPAVTCRFVGGNGHLFRVIGVLT